MTERRLIEDFLPVREISREASREKTAGRDYHLSTLHAWWARRPLAAARAAVLATLVPTSAFPTEREDLERFFESVAAWKGDEIGMSPGALEDARKLIDMEWNGSPPRVIDSFVGGGAIPLEILRLGGQAAGVELNPVAYLVGMATIVWPQTHGASLADDVRRWAEWVREGTLEEVGELYPKLAADSSARRKEQLRFQLGDRQQLRMQLDDPGGDLQPVAYLWSRTVPCPNPTRDPHQVPLQRSTHVVRKDNKRIAVKVVPNASTGEFTFDLKTDTGREPAARRGRSSASGCPLCGAAISPEYLKAQGAAGLIGFQLVAVVCVRQGQQGKYYLPADAARGTVPEKELIDRRLAKLAAVGLTPPDDVIQPMGNAGLASGQTYLYGIKTFADVFTARQLVTLLTLCKYVRRARQEMSEEGLPDERANVVAAYLGMIVNRVVDRSTSLSRWHPGEKVESPFVRDRLAMVWDFVEVHPFGGISGDYTSAIESVCKVIRHCALAGKPADLRRGTATELPFRDGSFDAAIIDPPYYDNVSYANSSDFYYVWLKRSIGHLFPEHLAGPVAPKKQEVIAAAYRHNKDKRAAATEYEELMTQALDELRRVLKPNSPLVVIYAHQTTAGWSTLIRSLRRAGFTVVEAWPVDTEMTERRGGQANASLASSIFLVARRRETEAVGSWAEVEAEFEKVITERVATLSELGISGADLVIAAVGAGLRPYTKYGAVELPNGEPLEPEAYLDEVQSAVLKTVLSDLMGVSRAGVEAVDPITQLYVVARFEHGDAFVPFDELNTLAHGVLAGARGGGMELIGPRGLASGAAALLTQEKDKLRFRDYLDRGDAESLGQPNGVPAPLVDVLHRLLWLAEREPRNLKDFLVTSKPDARQLYLVAQALSGSGLSGKGTGTSDREQAAIQRLLASWSHVVEDNLFGGRR